MTSEMVSALNTTFDYINALSELYPDQPWKAAAHRIAFRECVAEYDAGRKPESAVWFAMGMIQGIVGEELAVRNLV